MVNENSLKSPYKMILTDLLMGLIFIIIFGFSIWLIWITYLREHFDTGIIENSTLTTIEQINVTGLDKNDHFHNLDQTVYKITNSPSVCLKCHGSYPHSKSKHIRAFLNAHAYFMACEVCHLNKTKRPQVTFRWLDDKTGKELDFKPTNSRAKIIPIENVNGLAKRLDASSDKKFIDEYLHLRNTFDADQEAAAKLRIHRNVSDNPIVCDDCHTSIKTPYLPYANLSYSEQRISEIVGTEVVGVVKKYKRFYLPNLLQHGTF